MELLARLGKLLKREGSVQASRPEPLDRSKHTKLHQVSKLSSLSVYPLLHITLQSNPSITPSVPNLASPSLLPLPKKTGLQQLFTAQLLPNEFHILQPVHLQDPSVSGSHPGAVDVTIGHILSSEFRHPATKTPGESLCFVFLAHRMDGP